MRNQYTILAEKYETLYESYAPPLVQEFLDLIFAKTFEEFYSKAYKIIRSNVKYRFNGYGSLRPKLSKFVKVWGDTSLNFLTKNRAGDFFEKYFEGKDLYRRQSPAALILNFYGIFFSLLREVEFCVQGDILIKKHEGSHDYEKWKEWAFHRKRVALQEWNYLFRDGAFYTDYASIVVPALEAFIKELEQLNAAQTQHTSTHGVDLGNL